jgi:hypothetical protein
MDLAGRPPLYYSHRRSAVIRGQGICLNGLQRIKELETITTIISAIFSIIFIYSKSAGCSYLYYQKIFSDSLRLIRDEASRPMVRHV